MYEFKDKQPVATSDRKVDNFPSQVLVIACDRFSPDRTRQLPTAVDTATYGQTRYITYAVLQT